MNNRKKQVLIALATLSTKRVAGFFKEEQKIAWIYLGENFFLRRGFQGGLGDRFEELDFSRILDQVAKEIRGDYVRWVDSLNVKFGRRFEWWFGSLSSRNNSANSTFQNVCFLEVMKRIFHSPSEFPSLVVVESAGLAKSLAKFLQNQGVESVIGKAGIFEESKMASFRKFVSRWVQFFLSLFLRMKAAYVTRSESGLKKPIPGKPLVILETFVDPNSFSPDGTFHDRYFPSLREFLEKKGFSIFIYPIFLGYQYKFESLYSRMRASQLNFIIPEDYLSLKDFSAGLIFPIREYLRRFSHAHFHGFEISDILNENQKFASSFDGAHAILTYRLFLKLGEKGLTPERIIDWYENQVIDKALIAGARKAFPYSKILGAQMFIHYPNWLNLYPSTSEYEAKLTPDALLVMGRQQCEQVKMYENRLTSVVVGGGRYSHLFSPRVEVSGKIPDLEIFLLLPMTVPEALEILEKIHGAMKFLPRNCSLQIKSHPTVSSNTILAAFGPEKWPSEFLFFSETMDEALQRASIVVGGMSGSLVEAVAYGIPVVFVERQTSLNFNPFGTIESELIRTCQSSLEIGNAINHFIEVLPAKRKEFRELGLVFRDQFFCPTNDFTLTPFVE